MDLNKIKSILAKYFIAGCGITVKEDSFPDVLSILPLFGNDLHLQGLDKGSGHPDKELGMINSSARLAAFYYKLLESTGKISSLQFEWNESTPLDIPNRTIPPANLDVRYEIGNRIHFVESKYLEPYYSGNEKIRSSYKNKAYYPQCISNVDLWIDKFKQVENIAKYTNVTQLYRHLLAIYRHTLENPQLYDGKEIVLQSVSWTATDKFLKIVENESKRSKSYLLKRMTTIKDETTNVKDDINDFIRQLNWKNCSFNASHYNSMLKDICDSKHYMNFKTQYLF